MSLWSGTIGNLRSRLSLLELDFASWLDRTDADGEFKEHHSQVRRVTNVLGGAIKASTKNTALAGDTIPPPKFAALPDIRRTVGSVSLIWDFFRDKFAQRDVENLRRHLAVADDFAWECYKPFLNAAVAAGTVDPLNVKQPPLVFYSPNRAPYAQARTKTFDPIGIDSDDFAIFIEVLLKIPVPVIGMPWASANRVPDLVVVGHETGHVVAEDLGLASELKSLFANIDYQDDAGDRRKKCWKKWADEVFADVFGVYATGTSFAVGLAAEMAGDVDETRFAKVTFDKPGAYPTPSLRMALCERLLQKMAITSNTGWTETYGGITGDAEPFARDLAPIVEALMDQEWTHLGNRKLIDLLPWSSVLEEKTKTLAEEVLTLTFPDASRRQYVAASLLASAMNAKTYSRHKLDQVIAREIFAKRKIGLRSDDEVRSRRLASNLIAPGDGGDPLADSDEIVGKEIAELLGLVSN